MLVSVEHEVRHVAHLMMNNKEIEGGIGRAHGDPEILRSSQVTYAGSLHDARFMGLYLFYFI